MRAPIHHRMRVLLPMVLAIACAGLAILWPGWQTALRAQSVYFLQVAIDIKPGSDANCINPRSRGVFSVAILGSSVDITTIDVSTIEIDDDGDPITTPGVAPVNFSFNDVDGDGTTDLVLHFRTPELNAAGLLIDGNALYVTGELTTDDRFLRGLDQIFLAGGPNCLD